ncbi:MAG: alkaline phosphatase family protein [Actinomycetota bacterium]
MKVLLTILDGLADRPHKDLDGRTPLQAASTPVLDNLASLGITGTMYPISPGIAPSSDIAHFVLFGYPIEEFPGRGYLEALGEGFEIKDDEVVLRTSFVKVAEEPDHFQIVQRVTEHEEDLCLSLAKKISPEEFNGVKVRFVYTGQRQGLLFLEGDVSPDVTDSDPFSNNLPVIKVQPMADASESERAEKTASALNKFLLRVHEKLRDEPLNFLVAKWAGPPRRAGRKKALDPFWDRYSLKGASIASDILYKGLARTLGLDFYLHQDTPVIASPDEGGAWQSPNGPAIPSTTSPPVIARSEATWQSHSPQKDLIERFEKARKLMEQGYDFVHVHTKVPDKAAHTKNPELKKEKIEALDGAFSLFLDDSWWREDVLIAITADHATPSQGDLIHSGEAVPLAMVGPTVGTDNVDRFDEVSCHQGFLGQIYGRDLMPLILNYTDRIKYLGSRSFSKDYLAKPTLSRLIPLKPS